MKENCSYAIGESNKASGNSLRKLDPLGSDGWTNDIPKKDGLTWSESTTLHEVKDFSHYAQKPHSTN